MTEKIYFYRKLGTADFVRSETKKKIIPVRLKNQFLDHSEVFDSEKQVWQTTDSLPDETKDALPVEFVNSPRRTAKPDFRGKDFESLSPCEMADYEAWRRQESRFFHDYKNLWDSNKVRKDIFGAEIVVDQAALTLTMNFLQFDRVIDEIPSIKERTFFWNMKNGDVSNWNKTEKDIPLKKYLREAYRDNNFYPLPVLQEAYNQLARLAEFFTGIKAIADIADLESGNSTLKYLGVMYALTKIPCEPKLYGVLISKELTEANFDFDYSRTDTEILNKFLEKAGIKDYRILRENFIRDPDILLIYMRLHEGGFRDINLYDRVIESEEKVKKIFSFNRDTFIFFSKYSIPERGETATLNTLLKKSSDRYGLNLL